MQQTEAIEVLKHWDRQGRYVFLTKDFAKLFNTENPDTLKKSLARLVENGLLQRVAKGVYVNRHANSFDSYTLERIARALRRGKYNYVSLESMLSEYGVISQIPLGCMTVMTTGREGRYETPYGTIEFTHTQRSVQDILDNTIKAESRPLRMATKQAAWRDLKRVGRNTHLVDEEALEDD